jgi:inosose dehydratase
MTWGRQQRQAIDDIASLGFSGIQFRNIAIDAFSPAEMRATLSRHRLVFVALSSGIVDIDPAVEKEQIATHVAHARYVRDCGGLYLQVLDKLGNWPRHATPGECKRLGHLLTEIGKRTADLGIRLGYHNHLDTISQTPENLARVLDASDPRYVWLLLDTAHYYSGGGDPAQGILKFHDRLLFLHLKDVVRSPMGSYHHQKYPFLFVELGRGLIDFAAVFSALSKIRFHGWAVVELDHVPDKSTTPKEAAVVSRAYLEKTLGITV